jgi:hypothetical protein
MLKKKRTCFASVLLAMMILFSDYPLYASDFERLDSDGLEGQKPLSISTEETGGHTVWVGTDKGIFRKDISKNEPWQKIILEDVAEPRIHQITFSSYAPVGYAATSKGVYEIDPVSFAAHKIYFSSQDAENECFSVAVDAGKNIYIATKAGLFARASNGKRWLKTVTTLGDKAIDYVYASGVALYAAVSNGLYQSMDTGKTWKKVFSINSSLEEMAEDEGQEEAGEEALSDRIHAVIGEKGVPSLVYLATSFGGFRSQDAGGNWEPLPMAGLVSKDIINLTLSLSPRVLYALTRNGVFRLDADGWSVTAPLSGCRDFALVDGKIVIVTSLGIYAFKVSESRSEIIVDDAGKQRQKNIEEPPIQEVQRMVIRYCDVDNNKIALWHKQARTRALLPDLSFGYGNNVYGSYNGIFAVGPNDWQVNFSWDLGDLLYSSDQTSIDVRSRLMVQLRNDVLAEATQLYYERKRLLVEISDSRLPPEELSKKQIRLEEISALLDRLTGGAFSKLLKSSP